MAGAPFTISTGSVARRKTWSATEPSSTDSAAVRDKLADTSTVYKGVTGNFSLDDVGTPAKGASIISFSSEGSSVSTTLVDVVKELKTGRRFKVTEEAVIVAEEKVNNKKGKAAAAGDVFTSDFQNRLVELLGTKVKVVPKDEKKGKIEIEYYSPEDLERIYDLLNRPAQQTLKRKKPWLSV